MRQTKIQDMLKDHEERLMKLEKFNFNESSSEIAPINTKKGQEQRDKAREEMLQEHKKELKQEEKIEKSQKVKEDEKAIKNKSEKENENEESYDSAYSR